MVWKAIIRSTHKKCSLLWRVLNYQSPDVKFILIYVYNLVVNISFEKSMKSQTAFWFKEDVKLNFSHCIYWLWGPEFDEFPGCSLMLLLQLLQFPLFLNQLADVTSGVLKINFRAANDWQGRPGRLHVLIKHFYTYYFHFFSVFEQLFFALSQ